MIHYLHENGNDTNLGTLALPIKTWNELQNRISKGDTVKVNGSFDGFNLLPKTGLNVNYNFDLPTVIDVTDSKWNQVKIESYDCEYFIIDLRKEFIPVQYSGNVYKIEFDRVQENKLTDVYGGLWIDEFKCMEVFVNPANSPNPTFEIFNTVQEGIDYIEANPNTFYFDFSDPIKNVYYFHYSSGIVKTRYFDFFACQVDGGTRNDDCNYIEINDAHIIGAAHHNGTVWGKNIDLNHCIIEEYARHGVMTHGNQNDLIFKGVNKPFGGYDIHKFYWIQGEAFTKESVNCSSYTENSICYLGHHPQSGSQIVDITSKNGYSEKKLTSFDFQSQLKNVLIDGHISRNDLKFLNCYNGSTFKTNIYINNADYYSDILASEGASGQVISANDCNVNILNSRLEWYTNRHINISNSNGIEWLIKDTEIILHNSALTIPFLRLVNNYVSPIINLENCRIVNLGVKTDFIKSISGELGIVNIGDNVELVNFNQI